MRPMSETMRGFQGTRQRLVTLMEERRKEAEERRAEEANLAATLAVERAKSLLAAAVEKDDKGQKLYPTVDLQKAAAEVEVEDLARRYLIAKALRRSADEAVRTYEKELDALTAGYHAYNRELKVEEGLSNTPDSRQGGR